MEERLMKALESATHAMRANQAIPDKDQRVLCFFYQDLSQLQGEQRRAILDGLRGSSNDDVKGYWAKANTFSGFASEKLDGKARKLFRLFKDPMSGLRIQIEEFTPSPIRAIRYRVRVFTSMLDILAYENVQYAFDSFRRLRSDYYSDMVVRNSNTSTDPFVTVATVNYMSGYPFNTYNEAASVALEVGRLISEVMP